MSQQRKVLVWRDSWLPYSQTFVLDHLRTLDRYKPVAAGITVSNHDFDDLVAFRDTNGRSLGRLQKLNFRLFGYRKLRAFILRNQIDVVHAHFGPGAIQLLPVMRQLDIPFVVTFHGFDVVSKPQDGLKGKFYQRELKGVFDRADLLLPVSNFLHRELVELGSPIQKTLTHYLGTSVPPSSGKNGYSERSGILFVGRLVPSKGCLVLLRALSLAERIRSIPVTVVGDGPEKADLMRFARVHGLNVTFVGSQPHTRVVELMDSHRVFCLPSHRASGAGPEAFGLVFAEAAMRALPTIGIEEGGVPEAVVHGRTGLLCNQKRIDSLAKNIDILYNNPNQWSRFSMAAVAHATDNFDLRTRSARLESLYDRLLE